MNSLKKETQSPTRWFYDETVGKLIMIFERGFAVYVIKGKAKVGESNGFYRVATMEGNGASFLLWPDCRASYPS